MMKKRLCCVLTALLLMLTQLTGAGAPVLAEGEAELIRGTFRYAGMYNNQQDSELAYAYSDAYFAGDARVYDPSLSSMSLCLEMSSWSSLDEENWVDKTINARTLLTEIGFRDFAQNEFWNAFPTLESIGVVAARKQLGDSTLIALAVRGGGYFSEWGSNFLVGGEGEHDGFATARDNVLAFLRDYVADCGITGRVKLWIVGFSRGGAVANLTAGYLNQHGLTDGVTLAPEDLYCYTFEAPQGVQATEAGADADSANIHNIINPNDIVPLVAPANWGFSRYNQTSHLLPTITTAQYALARERMLAHYATIISTANVLDEKKAAYNIGEYAKTLEIKVNWLSFLPGGEPFVEILTVDNTHLPQSMMLVNSVSALIDAARSRDHFHAEIEADMARLLDELMGAEKGASLSAYIAGVGEALVANDYENLIYVLEPVVQLNFKSFEERMQEVSERLYEVIPQPEGYTDIVGTAGALVNVLATMLLENPQAVLDLVLSLSSTSMIQAHYAEVTMAWLWTEDPNFSQDPVIWNTPEAMRVVRVNCPVNLEVYDAQGNLVAAITDGVGTAYVEGIGCAVNEDGEMVVYLPSDAEFSIRIKAAGSGSVHCSINEFNVVRSCYTYVINYPAIPIREGDVLTAQIPVIDAGEFVDEACQGSNAPYRLLGSDGSEVPPEDIRRGDAAASHTVRADRNNENGHVLGGGVYVNGSYAQVEAYPLSGCSFLGWYVDGTKVSDDATYRFRVSEDVTLVAHFSDAVAREIRFAATEGGSVFNVDNSYTPGSQVLLSAAADEGYVLRGWQVDAGEIVTPDAHTAYFIVPDCDAVVTAIFARAGITCPGCQQVLPEGEHHLGLCGRGGHYSCKADYNPAAHSTCPICKAGPVCAGSHGMNEGQCGYVEPSPSPSPTPTPEPVESTTPEPEEFTTPEPVESTTPEPVESTTPEPVESTTPEPVESTTPEPVESTTPEPVESTTPEPVESTTPEPVESTTPEPVESTTPEPVESTTPEPVESTTPEPVESTTPEPVESTTPEPVESTTPEPVESTTPEPVDSTTPEPAESTTPEPVESTTPEPVESTTPEPVESTTPEPVESTTPEPAESTTPEPVESTTPEPVESTTPEPVESTTPEVTDTTTTTGSVTSRVMTPGRAARFMLPCGFMASLACVLPKWRRSGKDN